jgi:hypothetical protein
MGFRRELDNRKDQFGRLTFLLHVLLPYGALMAILQPSDILKLYLNVQAQVQSLGLMFSPSVPPGSPPGTPPPLSYSIGVEVKKWGFWVSSNNLPKLPIILVVGSDMPESAEPFHSEDPATGIGVVLAKYMATILLIAAGNRDNTANLDLWWNWREQQRRLFQWGMQAQIESCFKTEFIRHPPLMHEAWLKNYDASGLGLLMWNSEPATGAIN